MSISALIKCTAAIHQFAYGSTADAFDEYLQMTAANNDINVLDNSPLFDDLLDDLAHAVPYVVNKVEYRNGYYLADGIYPEWASFVKSFTVATDPKHTYFKQRQESAQKDVERAFGVLKGRWGLIYQPARAYEVNALRRIIMGVRGSGDIPLKTQVFGSSCVQYVKQIKSALRMAMVGSVL
nr:hypothetical protein [Tanacetum cinerariifolium]